MSDVYFCLSGSGVADNFIRNRIRKFFNAELVDKAPDGALVVTLSPENPLLDEALLSSMIEAARETGHSFRAVDAIPGTEPVQVGTGKAREYFSTTQHRYCTNFSIGRANRRKIFERLERRIPDLSQWPLADFLLFIESDEGVDFVLAYGEPVTLEYFGSCPSCKGSSLPLYSGTSHPITGFLTKNVSVYSHCINCGLTFLSRQMPRAELWRYYQEHSYSNPQTSEEARDFLDAISEATVSHFENYLAVSDYIDRVPENGRIGDLGAGRGEFAVLAKKAKPRAEVTAFEWRLPAPVMEELSRRDITILTGDVQRSLVGTGTYDLLTAWEVIEHLKVGDLPDFFRSVRSALNRHGHFVLSTPDFNNRYARALDFWAAAPGEHISVLSRRFLEPLLQASGLEIVKELHESVTLKRPNDWFAFGAATDVHFSSKGASSLVNDFLRDDDLRRAIRQKAREENLGSELILVCKAV